MYTKEHEWAKTEGDRVRVGITAYAQEQLGDVVFVELPKVGDTFDTNETFANVESVKAVSEVFCPVAGEIVEVNDALSESPQLVNDDCYGDGWFIKLKIADAAELKDLLNHEEYAEFVAEESAE
jgi:glycine cleavage system H protein